MKNLLIKKISIDSFKAFKDEITLIFDKPITIIYAQNGCGKTSLFEAIEWVLCEKEMNYDILKNKYSNKNPSVTITFDSGNIIYKELDSTNRSQLKSNYNINSKNKKINNDEFNFKEPYAFILYNKFVTESELTNVSKLTNILSRDNLSLLLNYNYMDKKIDLVERKYYKSNTKNKEIINDLDYLKKLKNTYLNECINVLKEDICYLYNKMQSNAFLISDPELLSIGNRTYNNISLSMVQNISLNLAIFLSIARTFKGSYFLDQPVGLFDGLNRISFLDILRTMILENNQQDLRFTISTTSRILVRQVREKFSLIKNKNGDNIYRIYSLYGNSKVGIQAIERDKYIMEM